MNGIHFVQAATKKELEIKVQEWLKDASEKGLDKVLLGWDPTRIIQTEEGYKIQVWATIQNETDPLPKK